jgi:hypothetical protein
MAKREITKGKILLTIDKTVLADLDKFCKNINMNKSAYVQHLIKDSLVTTVQLFSSTETLAEAIVILSNQISEIQKLMQDPNYIQQNQRFNEAKNGLQINSDLSERA